MKTAEWIRKVQFIAMLAMGSYPIAACTIIFIAPAMLPHLWLFPAIYSAVCLLSFAIPGKLRLATGLLGGVLLLLPWGLLLEGSVRSAMVIYALGYGGLLLWSVRIPGWDTDQELSAGWLGAGFAILLFGCLLSRYEPRLASVAVWLRVSFFLFAFFAMLSLNRRSLLLAAGKKPGFSPAMRHKNVLLTIGMFAIALAVGLLPSAFHLLKRLLGWLKMLAEKVAQLFPEATMPETTVLESTQASLGEGMGALLEGLPSGHTSQATYIIMAVIALGVMIPLGCFALYKLVTALYRKIRKLAEDIISAAGNQVEDFQDEITDTREDGESEHFRGKAKAAKPILPMTGKMTPTEQIRYRYRRLAEKHPEWKHSHTARENLPKAAAQLYERARYSDHVITEQDAETFKNETK